MKRSFFSPMVAIALMFGIIGFFSFKPANTKTSSTEAKFVNYDWYPVNFTTQLTTSTTAAITNKTKDQAIAAQDCNDQHSSTVCLVGVPTGGTPPAVGTPASGFSAPERIKKRP